MIRSLLVYSLVSLILSSCSLGGNGATMIQTDEKALLGSPTNTTQETQISSEGTNTSTPWAPISESDATQADTEISPVSDVVSPIGE